MFAAASEFFLSCLFSICILFDSGKTGYRVDRDRIKSIRESVGKEYPDFLMKAPF